MRAPFERLSPYDPELNPDAGPFLLGLEPENFSGDPPRRRQLRLDVTASKSYELYALSEAGEENAPDLELVKVSEHGLGHLLDPRDRKAATRAGSPKGRSTCCGRRSSCSRSSRSGSQSPRSASSLSTVLVSWRGLHGSSRTSEPSGPTLGSPSRTPFRSTRAMKKVSGERRSLPSMPDSTRRPLAGAPS